MCRLYAWNLKTLCPGTYPWLHLPPIVPLLIKSRIAFSAVKSVSSSIWKRHHIAARRSRCKSKPCFGRVITTLYKWELGVLNSEKKNRQKLRSHLDIHVVGVIYSFRPRLSERFKSLSITINVFLVCRSTPRRAKLEIVFAYIILFPIPENTTRRIAFRCRRTLCYDTASRSCSSISSRHVKLGCLNTTAKRFENQKNACSVRLDQCFLT